VPAGASLSHAANSRAPHTDQQMPARRRHARPHRIHVTFTITHHRDHGRRCQHRSGTLDGVHPAARFPFRQRPLPLRRFDRPITVPHLATHQAQACAAVRIHRHHDMRQYTMGGALVQRSQPATARIAPRALTAAAGKRHRRGVLDCQHMPSGDRCAGVLAPAVDNLCCRYLGVGKEAPSLQLPAAAAAQSAQADGFTQHHAFDDCSPPLSRRASPNCPSDQFIVARPLPLLLRGNASYRGRAGQAIFASLGSPK
jgi:hypothetical protein